MRRPLPRDEPAEGEARVAVEYRERGDEGHEPDRPLGGDPRQEHALEPDLPEPEPVREAGGEGGDQEKADREERQGDGKDPPRRRRRRAVDPARRGRTNAGLPQAADERIVVFRWQLAHWSGPVWLVNGALAGAGSHRGEPADQQRRLPGAGSPRAVPLPGRNEHPRRAHGGRSTCGPCTVYAVLPWKVALTSPARCRDDGAFRRRSRASGRLRADAGLGGERGPTCVSTAGRMGLAAGRNRGVWCTGLPSRPSAATRTRGGSGGPKSLSPKPSRYWEDV